LGKLQHEHIALDLLRDITSIVITLFKKLTLPKTNPLTGYVLFSIVFISLVGLSG